MQPSPAQRAQVEQQLAHQGDAAARARSHVEGLVACLCEYTVARTEIDKLLAPYLLEPRRLQGVRFRHPDWFATSLAVEVQDALRASLEFGSALRPGETVEGVVRSDATAVLDALDSLAATLRRRGIG